MEVDIDLEKSRGELILGTSNSSQHFNYLSTMKTKSITALLLALLLWAGCEQPAQDSNDQPTYRKAQLVEGLVVTTKSKTPNEPPQKLFIVMKRSVVDVDSARVLYDAETNLDEKQLLVLRTGHLFGLG